MSAALPLQPSSAFTLLLKNKRRELSIEYSPRTRCLWIMAMVLPSFESVAYCSPPLNVCELRKYADGNCSLVVNSSVQFKVSSMEFERIEQALAQYGLSVTRDAQS